MATRSEQAKQIRREKAQTDRYELFISDYVKHKYPNIYAEADRFFKLLREKNPGKLNLTKTQEYRAWLKQDKKNPEKTVNTQKAVDNMELKIPLMDMGTFKTNELTPTAEIIAEGDFNSEPPIEELLSPDLVDEIMKELKEDPVMKAIITDLEDQINFEELEIGMDMEVEADIRLQGELL